MQNHNDLIKFDIRYPECTSINTEVWLERVLGPELDYECDGRWLMEQEYKILEYVEAQHPGINYKRTAVENVYNSENDFSDVFQWQVFYPEGKDWCWADDVYVAAEVHQGGDVRGNYGRVRLYRADDLADSGFLDWCLGWSVNYSDGAEVPENDRFSIGYASHPFYEMAKHLKRGDRGIAWSAKRQAFLSTYRDGRYVELHPCLYV